MNNPFTSPFLMAHFAEIAYDAVPFDVVVSEAGWQLLEIGRLGQRFGGTTDFAIYRKDTALLIAYRGTATDDDDNPVVALADWFTNLDVKMTDRPEAGKARFHGGYWKSYQASSPYVEKWIERFSVEKVTFLGHSKGAGESAAGAVDVARKHEDIEIDWWGFGVPRLGNRVMIDEMCARVRVHAYAHILDPITYLPALWRGYRHVPLRRIFTPLRFPLSRNHSMAGYKQWLAIGSDVHGRA